MTAVSLAAGPDGSLWVGTYDRGLAWLGKDGHWQNYSKDTSNGSLPNDSVSSLAVSADGALWVGTAGGLARLVKDGPWETYDPVTVNVRLADRGVGALSRSPDGTLWVGTFDGLLARRGADESWQTYDDTPVRRPDAKRLRIWIIALTLSPDGSLWVATNGGGLSRLTNGHWQTYTKTSTNGGLPDDHVHTLVFDSNRALWAGTKHGLARLDTDGRWWTYTTASAKGRLPDDFVRALAGNGPPKPIRCRRTDRKEIGWYGFAAQGGCTPIIGSALLLIGKHYIGRMTLLIRSPPSTA